MNVYSLSGCIEINKSNRLDALHTQHSSAEHFRFLIKLFDEDLLYVLEDMKTLQQRAHSHATKFSMIREPCNESGIKL